MNARITILLGGLVLLAGAAQCGKMQDVGAPMAAMEKPAEPEESAAVTASAPTPLQAFGTAGGAAPAPAAAEPAPSPQDGDKLAQEGRIMAYRGGAPAAGPAGAKDEVALEGYAGKQRALEAWASPAEPPAPRGGDEGGRAYPTGGSTLVPPATPAPPGDWRAQENQNALKGAEGQGAAAFLSLDRSGVRPSSESALRQGPAGPADTTVALTREPEVVDLLATNGKRDAAKPRPTVRRDTAQGVDHEVAEGEETTEESDDGVAIGRKTGKMDEADANGRFADRKRLRDEDRRGERGGERFKREKELGNAEDEQTREAVSDGDAILDVGEDERPASFLSRMLYFENTYLGGNAAYAESLRRLDAALGPGERAHLLARLRPQGFDAPPEAGIALSATIDRQALDRPGRVYLQVGLQGSERYGWRRPPLDVALVVDDAVLGAGAAPVTDLVVALLQQLGAQDRLAVFVAGEPPLELAPLSRLRPLRNALPLRLEALDRPRGGAAPAAGLAAALGAAGQALRGAAADGSALPGTQTVFLLTTGADAERVASATAAAHDLTLQGIVTSVVALDDAAAGADGAWWAVASAGYGNYHRVDASAPVSDAVSAELASLSRVVARLLRLNIRLGKDAHAVRILGSRVLDEEEARQVKAREVAADRELSRTMGIQADRGEDDDGLQTVIPYFFGGDTHVVLVELWVDAPGAVAEVTLRYKDMVNLKNDTARAAVALRHTPRMGARTQVAAIRRNVRGFELAGALERAGHRVRHGDAAGAAQWLQAASAHAAHTAPADRQLLAEFARLVGGGDWQQSPERQAALSEALVLAGRRRVGVSADPAGPGDTAGR